MFILARVKCIGGGTRNMNGHTWTCTTIYKLNYSHIFIVKSFVYLYIHQFIPRVKCKNSCSSFGFLESLTSLPCLCILFSMNRHTKYSQVTISLTTLGGEIFSYFIPMTSLEIYYQRKRKKKDYLMIELLEKYETEALSYLVSFNN